MANEQAPAQEGVTGAFGNVFQAVVRGALFYWVFSNLTKKPDGTSPGAPNVDIPVDPSSVASPSHPPSRHEGLKQIQPIMQRGDKLDMWVYVMEDMLVQPDMTEYADSLVWYESGIELGVYEDPPRTKFLQYKASEDVINNGTVWSHVFFARAGEVADVDRPDFTKVLSFGRTHNLIEYRKRPKAKVKQNLMGKKDKNLLGLKRSDDEEEEEGAQLEPAYPPGQEPVISYWKPNMTINIVDDFTTYPYPLPPQLRDEIEFSRELGGYLPALYMNDFWLMKGDHWPVNHTTPILNLTLEVGLISLWKWQFQMSTEQSFKQQAALGGISEGDPDDLKKILVEGNPILLGVTGVVSLLHSVFDFLAFKNDVNFWRKNKSMEGLSQRSIVVNCVCQVVIFLYLLDNDTSWMILISNGVGMLIEFWKITKACQVSIDRSGWIPRLRMQDRDSYVKSNTRTYDEQAGRYLSWVLYPLLIGYSVYSLFYNEHKGWYSWLLNSFVGAVYLFGFIMMCPQLFINYKMKSVAHMPWRQMTYKFLNTIIDDLFAFVIKMPLMHRLSCFRDDLIFLIYLYQRWCYPVDMKRVNEFGFGGDDEDAAKELPAGAEGEGEALLQGAAQGGAGESQGSPQEASSGTPAVTEKKKDR